jgi:membrane-associated phospholipid phosphatase
MYPIMFISASSLPSGRRRFPGKIPEWHLTSLGHGLKSTAAVSTPISFLHDCLGVANPLAGVDHRVAYWFHDHLTRTFVSVLRAFSEFGAAESIGVALFCLVIFFAFKRWWPRLITLVIAVPGGMLLNEWIKILVHRHRPFVDGPFADWSGYSFASGHTIGATLLYGQLALFVVPAIKNRRWRMVTIAAATLFVLLVGFSRVALGVHYLTDVLAAICLGLVWLTLCLLVGKPFRHRSEPLPATLIEQAEALVAPTFGPTETVEQPALDSRA